MKHPHPEGEKAIIYLTWDCILFQPAARVWTVRLGYLVGVMSFSQYYMNVHNDNGVNKSYVGKQRDDASLIVSPQQCCIGEVTYGLAVLKLRGWFTGIPYVEAFVGGSGLDLSIVACGKHSKQSNPRSTPALLSAPSGNSSTWR